MLMTAVPGVAHGAPPLGERAAAARVCLEGPAARIAEAERSRGEAEVVAAEVLPNPALVAEHQSDLAGRDEHETVIGLSMPLGIGGRRFLLQDAADARRTQARARAEGTLLGSALAFRSAYAELVLAEARVAIVQHLQQALDDLSGSLAKLAQGGESADYDRRRLDSQARTHRRHLRSLRAQVAASRARLNGWLEEP
ncbi:MAG: TolC family protein, partial [Deltaproteobacteria bacterium]|nr:TolC family protein [Deltaproteobacteria bacterium]